MNLAGKKIGILIENKFETPEIQHYEKCFREEGAEIDFLSRLWGYKSLGFDALTLDYKISCHNSFEDISDEGIKQYSAIIVPGGFVSDNLRYSEKINQDAQALPPVTYFLKKIFANTKIIKGIICHGMWIMAFSPELVKNRRVTVSNNLIADVKALEAQYVNEDVVVDKDLITGRTSGHRALFTSEIIKMLKNKSI
jgi:protease I